MATENIPYEDPRRRSPIQRLKEMIAGYPRPIWVLAISIFVLWVGRGMVVPFTVIFFTQIVGISGATVGTGIAVASLLGIAFVTITASQIDKRGGRPVLIVAILIFGIATFLYAWTESAMMFLLSTLVLYLASQSYWPAVDTVTAALADKDNVITSMSILRVANAMGIGVGGFIGGIMVAGGGLSQYRIMFMTGAVIILISAFLIWFMVPRTPPVVVPESESGEGKGGWSVVLADRTFLYSLIVLFIMVLGFTQVQMSVPPFLRREAGASESYIGSLFLMSTIILILVQVPIAARISRANPGRILSVGALFWALAFAFMMLTAQAGSAAILVFLAFTAGELIFMPVSSILAVRLSAEHLRGRYFSLLSITWGGSFAIATLTAGFVQDASRPILLWPAMVFMMVLAAIGAYRLRRVRRLQPEADDVSAPIVAESASELLPEAESASTAGD